MNYSFGKARLALSLAVLTACSACATKEVVFCNGAQDPGVIYAKYIRDHDKKEIPFCFSSGGVSDASKRMVIFFYNYTGCTKLSSVKLNVIDSRFTYSEFGPLIKGKRYTASISGYGHLGAFKDFTYSDAQPGCW